MDPIHAAVLGAAQGLTEFLPISSSGHLIMLPYVLGWPEHSQTFDLALHLGTLVALAWFFWADWLGLVRGFFSGLVSSQARATDPWWRMACLVLVGSIPAAAVGVVAEQTIETLFRSPILNAGLLIAFALVLLIADLVGSHKRGMDELTWLDAVSMGLAQAVALMPGVSRSGVTMSAGLFRGLDRPGAARFSFLLSGPIILGAALFKLRMGIPQSEWFAAAIGIATSAFVGFLAIGLLLRYLQRHSVLIFVIYRVAMGVLVIWVGVGRANS
jgi:undecaprenyl-diphosphatase